MINKHLKTTTLLFVVFSFAFLFGQSIVSFSENVYYYNPDSTVLEVCYDIQSNDLSEVQNVFIKADSSFKNIFYNLNDLYLNSSINGENCFDIPIGQLEIDPQTFEVGQLNIDVNGSTNVLTGENPFSVIVSSPLTTGQPEPTDNLFLIKGFDNDVNEGWRLSLLNLEEVKQNQFIGITNSNFDEQQGWLAKNTSYEYLELEYTGTEPLPKFTTLCIKGRNDTTGIGTGSPFSYSIDGDASTDFQVKYNTTSLQFLTESNWTNAYIYGQAFANNDFTNLWDGITFGIEKQSYPFDIPFAWPNMQLFFFDSIASEIAYLDCEEFNENCGIIEYFKSYENWFSKFGSTNDELVTLEICAPNCEFVTCTDSLFIVENCISDSIDVIYLMDESGSVSSAEMEDMLIGITSSSEEFKCRVPNSRFAFTSFAATNEFFIIQPFQNAPLNVIGYQKQCNSCQTDVDDAIDTLNYEVEFGNLALRQNVDYILMILTDAPNSNADEFTFINYARNTLNARDAVVYYTYDSLASYPNFTAYSSYGGSYYGAIANNPGDLLNGILPRLFYPYESFGADLTEVVRDINRCDTLTLNFSGDTTGITVDISTNNGAQVIDTINPLQYLVNYQGTFSFVLKTNKGCNYSATITYEEDVCNQSLNPILFSSRNSSKKDKKSYSNSIENEGITSSFYNEDTEGLIEVYPVPTKSKLYIETKYTYESPIIEVYSSSGVKIQVEILRNSPNQYLLNTSKLIPGVYYIKLNDEPGNSVFKKFIVIQ